MCFYSEERICNMHPRLKKLCEDTNRSGQDVGIQNMNGDGHCKVTAEWIRWGFNLDNPSIAVGAKMRFVKTVQGFKVAQTYDFILGLSAIKLLSGVIDCSTSRFFYPLGTYNDAQKEGTASFLNLTYSKELTYDQARADIKVVDSNLAVRRVV